MFSFGEVAIRRVERKDLSWLRRLHNDQTTWSFLNDISLLSEGDQVRWFERIEQSVRDKYFILCLAGNKEKVGLVRCNEIDFVNRSIRVGLDIAPRFRGTGLGRAGYELILKYCFDYLGMHRVWLLVSEFNHIGIALYTSVGFYIEGRQRENIYRDGRYHDQLVMGILEREFRGWD